MTDRIHRRIRRASAPGHGGFCAGASGSPTRQSGCAGCPRAGAGSPSGSGQRLVGKGGGVVGVPFRRVKLPDYSGQLCALLSQLSPRRVGRSQQRPIAAKRALRECPNLMSSTALQMMIDLLRIDGDHAVFNLAMLISAFDVDLVTVLSGGLVYISLRWQTSMPQVRWVPHLRFVFRACPIVPNPL